MSDTVIRVENLSKKYVLQHQRQEGYATLRDTLSNTARSLLRPSQNSKSNIQNPTLEEFWALKDVSFEIKRGDRVGIIGRNGAGKSTLLKVLSRITEPTQGSIHIKGRVASLLEVGTGFHPELTGRENIFLNGAILGMGKTEIQRKFDEIVAFAEVEKFLDTPVKRYSSGMYVRLAFAVAAHLEPEILIVDEVLAVGDSAFQKKCLGKMEDVTKEGRTILFVSHQMAAIENLCNQVIMLRSGKVEYIGDTKSGIQYYLKSIEAQSKDNSLEAIKRSGNGKVRLTGFSIEDCQGNPLASVACGDDVVFVFHYQAASNQPASNVSLGFSLHTTFGDRLSVLYSDYSGDLFPSIPPTGKLKCRIKDFPYSTGRYLVGARIMVNDSEADWPQGYIGYVDVEAGDFYGTGTIGKSGLGPVLIRGSWQIDDTEGYSRRFHKSSFTH